MGSGASTPEVVTYEYFKSFAGSKFKKEDFEAITNGATSISKEKFLELQQAIDVFLSHDWEIDDLNRNTHERIRRVNESLKDKEVITWLDSERMNSHNLAQLNTIIQRASVVVICITKTYIQLAEDTTINYIDRGSISEEFRLISSTKDPNYVIPILMEPHLVENQLWSGAVGTFINSLPIKPIDFSDENFDFNIENLYKGISNCEKLVFGRYPRLNAGCALRRLQSISDMSTWLIESVNKNMPGSQFTLTDALNYAKLFIDNDVGNLHRLGRIMNARPDILQTVFNITPQHSALLSQCLRASNLIHDHNTPVYDRISSRSPRSSIIFQSAGGSDGMASKALQNVLTSGDSLYLTNEELVARLQFMEQKYQALQTTFEQTLENLRTVAHTSPVALVGVAASGKLPEVVLLLSEGIYVDTTDKDECTALIRATMNGHVDIVRFLLNRDANTNWKNSHGWTALTIATEKGYLEIVQLLLEKDADVNEQTKSGATPLFLASSSGNESIVSLLLGRGANVDIQDMNGSTALIEASEKGYVEVVRLLLDHNANLELRKGNGAMKLACGNGHSEVVSLLLNKGAKINNVPDNGWPLLLTCAWNGHTDTVDLLLKNGADADAHLNDGDTALMFSACKGHLEIVKLLLRSNANINTQNKDGYTALMRAAINCHIETVELLLKSGADRNIQDKHRKTAYMKASNSEIQRLLR